MSWINCSFSSLRHKKKKNWEIVKNYTIIWHLFNLWSWQAAIYLWNWFLRNEKNTGNMQKNQIRFREELLQRQGTSVGKPLLPWTLLFQSTTYRIRGDMIWTQWVSDFFNISFLRMSQSVPWIQPSAHKKTSLAFSSESHFRSWKVEEKTFGKGPEMKVCLQLVSLEEMCHFLPRAWSSDKSPCRHWPGRFFCDSRALLTTPLSHSPLLEHPSWRSAT